MVIGKYSKREMGSIAKKEMCENSGNYLPKQCYFLVIRPSKYPLFCFILCLKKALRYEIPPPLLPIVSVPFLQLDWTTVSHGNRTVCRPLACVKYPFGFISFLLLLISTLATFLKCRLLLHHCFYFFSFLNTRYPKHTPVVPLSFGAIPAFSPHSGFHRNHTGDTLVSHRSYCLLQG